MNIELLHLCSVLNEWSNTEILFFSTCSYAEVRAERRRELGIEESLPETAADKVCILQIFIFKEFKSLKGTATGQIHTFIYFQEV